MKPRTDFRSIIILSIILCICFSAYAQKDSQLDKELSYLSQRQKELLKEQQQLLDETRAIFKNNLSEEQLRLLNDRSISKEQRTALLKKSLTDNQRDLISANRRAVRLKKVMFRKSLTRKQRFRLRKFLQNRSLNDRKRLVRRLRRLIRNNMD